MYDCIIIGTGAAGVSAALTLKALNKNFLLVGSKNLSKKIRSAEKIKNYPGLAEVSGKQLFKAFSSQLEGEGIGIFEGRVNAAYKTDNGFALSCGGDILEGKTVIVATGVEAVKSVEGEAELLGRGVSYCAVCDGFLYKDKDIAVFCESEEEAEEVNLLSSYAKKVYLFTRVKNFPFAKNVEICGDKIDKICGSLRVEGVICGDKQYKVDGAFMLKQSVSASVIFSGLQCENGAIKVDRRCATNIVGVFAAGDCTGKPYQYVKAAGEGNVCAHSVAAYLR